MVMQMDVGQVVDYIIEWNKRMEEAAEEKPKRRKATQADWDALG